MQRTPDNRVLDDYGNDVDVTLWGESEDGHYVLVVTNDAHRAANNSAFVCSQHDGHISGPRWECSATHLEYYAEVYRKRFPVEVA